MASRLDSGKHIEKTRSDDLAYRLKNLGHKTHEWPTAADISAELMVVLRKMLQADQILVMNVQTIRPSSTQRHIP